MRGRAWTWEADLKADVMVVEAGFWEGLGRGQRGPVEAFEFVKDLHPGDQRVALRAWREHLEGKTDAYAARFRLRTASNEWRWFEARGRVTGRAADGTALTITGEYTDITAEREAEEALAMARGEVEALLGASRDAIFVFEPDLSIRKMNRAATRLLTIILGAAPGRGPGFLEHPLIREFRPFLDEVRLALEGKWLTAEREFQLPGKPAAWFEGSFAPLTVAGGQVAGAVAVVRSVTERKRLEAAREQGQELQMLGLMTGGIAHDFNNFLTAIIGNLELVAMDLPGAEESWPLADAREAARRGAELVTELLAFAGRGRTVRRQVDVSGLAAEVVRYARRIPGPPVPIEQELAPVPPVEADPTQLRQLVMNLLVNAIEATRGFGSRVTVRTRTLDWIEAVGDGLAGAPRAAGQYVLLQVTDDGAGMDPETRARVFDPFFTTKPAGHGLGLANALGAVRSHGGSITLESEPGRGASFTVLLPVS